MKVLILVDIQNDFCPLGALAVENGDQVVKIANKLMEADVFDMVVATQDWHPKNHGSFASNQGTRPFTQGELNGIPQTWWPDHCVQGSEGAELHPDLNLNKVAAIFRKGMNPNIDSYSAFLNNDKSLDTQTGVAAFVEIDKDTDLYIMGLATDYCVKFTAIDAAYEFNYNTHLIKDGCRAVNANPDDGDRAIEEMKAAGVAIVTSDEVING